MNKTTVDFLLSSKYAVKVIIDNMFICNNNIDEVEKDMDRYLKTLNFNNWGMNEIDRLYYASHTDLSVNFDLHAEMVEYNVFELVAVERL
jgi:hypothetical protein